MYTLWGFTYSLDAGYDAERTADTIKEAKKEARYMLSDEYRRASEASTRIRTVQIWKDGHLVDQLEAR